MRPAHGAAERSSPPTRFALDAPTAVNVLGIAWVGTRTDRFREMASFYDEVLGFDRWIEDEGFLAYRLPNGDVAELFGPGEGAHDHFTTGPVAGFLVEDLSGAIEELADAGIEILGVPVVEASGSGWAHFRAPDGNIYEVTANREHPAHRARTSSD